MTTPQLDRVTAALVTLAAAIAGGAPDTIAERVREAIGAGVPALAIDELMLQSVLTVGWPRALVAAGVWREASGTVSADGESGIDYADHAEWTRRGEATCRTIYGDSYDKLRSNVSRLHPALDAWMVTEGYGRTLARPGLGLRERELCTVAQTAMLCTPRQLHSHLLGALRAGATIGDVEATMQLLRPLIEDDDWPEVEMIWRRVADTQTAGGR